MTLREQDPVLALVPDGWHLQCIVNLFDGRWSATIVDDPSRAFSPKKRRRAILWDGMGLTPLAAVADAAKRIEEAK